MRILLVDTSAASLQTCADKLVDISSSDLGVLGIDIRVARDSNFHSKLFDADILVFGPQMAERATEVANEVLKLTPELPLIVLLSETDFKQNPSSYQNSHNIRAVLPMNASPGELEQALLRIHKKSVLSIESEVPAIFSLKYEIVRIIGTGITGVTYLCKHRELSGVPVAVKILRREVARDAVLAERFRNEVFTAYAVSHPNVLRHHEYLRDGDLIACTMEYVAGGNLADFISRSDTIPIPKILALLSEICSGVQALHDAGIVHCDLKPQNILLTSEGVVKISGFGTAASEHAAKRTEPDPIVGTLDYVSPEYIRHSHFDVRSDLYSIGVLAYELLTERNPFIAESVYASMTKRLKMDPAPPSTLRRECPQVLDAIILRALARDPQRRYSSAAEMFNDLQLLRGEDRMPNLPIATAPSFLAEGRTMSPSHTGPQRFAMFRITLLLAALGLGTCIGVVLASYYFGPDVSR